MRRQSGSQLTQGSPNRTIKSRGKTEGKKRQKEDLFVLGPTDFYCDNFIINFKDPQYVVHKETGKKLEIKVNTIANEAKVDVK